ncbi:hypothetical protein GCM10009557_10960 [Virgisporangium ochraceum]|uniref:Uncharacterized protein n=1 Tax=Virgisporangium ochraceum TaxID=65505 RepID=A0A8J3ZSU6_9ACTN|nr:hypothetical protein [Virgisporangium ochraceum]GIJ67755.1 hypothetical protein Voc01_026720 [Virgisporangium ochraceum]
MSYNPAGGVGVDPGPSVPPPPPGPGAAPPFASPPTERDKRRTWVAIGVAAAVLVLCCVGGVGGIGVVIWGGVEQSKDQAAAVVGEFLDRIDQSESAEARRLVCEDLPPRVSANELVNRTASIEFRSYEVGEPTITNTIDVPVTLTTGSSTLRQLYLVGAEGTSACILDILAG